MAALIAASLGLAHEARAGSPNSPNLLLGKAPARSSGVRRAGVLTDGTAAREGDTWNSALTAPFGGSDAFVLYDLGSSQPIAAAWLQGDNNDDYLVDVSDDGEHFSPLWRALAETRSGLRARFAGELHGVGRFVRVRAEGGDGRFALSELQLFAGEPAVFPPEVPRATARAADEHVRDLMLDLGVALVAAVLLAGRGSRPGWRLALLALPAAATVALINGVWNAWPLDARAVSIARGILAAVAAVAVGREVWAPPRFPADRRFVLGTLTVCGLLSVLAFYNLGQPQFWDKQRGRATFVHHLDLRQYYPTAKYFRELGYRGIYEADLAAYAESTGTSLDALAGRSVRDLAGDYAVVTAGDLKDAIVARRARFTPARWEQYKRDATFFRDAMGDAQWLETLEDFGGNASPVWMSLAHCLWAGPPSPDRFAALALLDLFLFALGFAFIGRAFGPRTMLVCMVVFGANDYIMYGSNWAGATLRHDWLMYLALAACALKLGRPAMGGALIAAASMIRAFPILALAGVAMPMGWTILAHLRTHHRLPSLQTLRAEHREIERVFLGAAVTIALLFGLSSLVLSPGAWPEWFGKASQLSAQAHPADISFRSFVGGWGETQAPTLNARLPVILLVGGLFLLLAFAASWKARPARSMLLGLALVPVLMNPANYYSHLVCLLPMLGDPRPGDGLSLPRSAGPAVWLTLLFMCVVQYFTELITDRPLHFYLNTSILMATLGTVLFLLARQRALAAGLWANPIVAGSDSKIAVNDQRP